MKVVVFLHTFTQSFRHMFVLSGMGSVSYCKHSPTCSEYTFEKIKQDGYVLGTLKGAWRVLQCW